MNEIPKVDSEGLRLAAKEGHEKVSSVVDVRTANGQTPEELAVAHGIANYQRIMTERDELKKQLDRANQMATIAKIEIEELRAKEAAAQTRIQSYQMERDDAVANLVVYQTLFVSVQSLLRTFGIENAPLVKDEAQLAPSRIPSKK